MTQLHRRICPDHQVGEGDIIVDVGTVDSDRLAQICFQFGTIRVEQRELLLNGHFFILYERVNGQLETTTHEKQFCVNGFQVDANSEGMQENHNVLDFSLCV